LGLDPFDRYISQAANDRPEENSCHADRKHKQRYQHEQPGSLVPDLRTPHVEEPPSEWNHSLSPACFSNNSAIRSAYLAILYNATAQKDKPMLRKIEIIII
jgi:hypothetical protein